MSTIPFILALSALVACTPEEEDVPKDTGAEDSGGPDDSAQDSADTAQDSADSGRDSGADPDTDVDSGGDTADSAGDTSDSGVVDTADSGAEDTADTGAACTTGTARDLVYTVEVRDSRGVAGTSFATTESLTVAGVVTNPCPTEITFSTSNTCLVTDIVMSGSGSMGYGVSFACGGAVTLWSVTPGASIEVAEVVGRLPADTYEVTANFNLRGTSATTTIEVR